LKFGDLQRNLRKLLEEAFVPREVFFRSGDRFHHFPITVRVQRFAAVAGVVAVGWTLFASGSFVVQQFVLSSKNSEIERQQLAYFDLLSEVGEYHDQFSRITRGLEENQEYLLSVLESSPGGRRELAKAQDRLKESETEQARVVVARDGLRTKMRRFEKDLRQIASRNISLQTQVAKMRSLIDASQAERDQVTAARERLNQRLVDVERELAEAVTAKRDIETQMAGLNERFGVTQSERDGLAQAKAGLESNIAELRAEKVRESERQEALKNRVATLDEALSKAIDTNTELNDQRDYLERRVGGLEQRLVDLRDAGQSVIGRLSEQTQLSLDMIEKTVEMTGLDTAALLKSSPGGALGQGGPFVPVENDPAAFEPSFQLEASVTTLDQKIDRWTALQDIVRSLPLTMPLSQYRVTSRYGARRDPVNGRKARHSGADLAAPSRTPVYVTAPGKVVYAGWRGNFGRTIEIDHGYGIRTRYAHLRKILVKVGQQVENREKIGLVGSSGRSTGPHVHYEVRYKGRAQNPMKFLKAGNYVFKG
jgi:murein DD-endopeptidase MepM/ murein hydrolase activator NlpD